MREMITLATLPQATEQEVFDQVATHLLTQMKKSLNGYACVYRNQNGLKCAAGCLIGDHEYKRTFDYPQKGMSAWSSLICNELVPNTHESLISSLQIIHDESEPTEWEERLQNLARNLGLQFTPLKTLNS